MRTAYNRCVEKILVSDAGEQSARIAYLYNALSALLPACRPRLRFLAGQSRSAVVLEGAGPDAQFRDALRETIAETIAIGYKYSFLSAALPLEGLALSERKLFLCALIAADLVAEKKYIRTRLQESGCLRDAACALDGFFVFRLKGLKEKWDKIASYVPPDFTREEMDRFMRYFVDGNAGRAYVDGCSVYDGKYRLCRRGTLVGADGPGELSAAAEILLCGAAEIHVCRPLSDGVAVFLRRYYGAHTFFERVDGEEGKTGKKVKNRQGKRLTIGAGGVTIKALKDK